MWDIVENTVGSAVDWYINSDLANTQQQNNLELQKLQHMYNRDLYKHRYQWTVEDMAKAGLNPILAATGGLGGASSPSGVSSPSAGLPSMPGSFASGFSAFQSGHKSEAEKKRHEAETTKVLVERSLKLEEMKKVRQEIIKTRAESGEIQARERVHNQTLFNLEKKFLLMSAERNKLDMEIRNLQVQETVGYTQLENIRLKKDQIEANTKEILANVRRIQAEYQQLLKISKVYSGPAGQALTYIREIVNALGITGIVPLGKFGGKK